MHPQSHHSLQSLHSPSAFWHSHAQKLCWETQYTTPLHAEQAEREWRWFPGGRISTTYNLVTRHVLSGRGAQKAIIWDSPVTGRKGVISYAELQDEVEVFAEVLRGCGVREGDRVLVYMPMIPSCMIALLAIAHLGAIHTVVFGGFSPVECAKRIQSARPKVVLTASCGIEGRRVIPYLPLVREAISKSDWKPQNTLVLQRDELYVSLDKSLRELNWNSLVRSLKTRLGTAFCSCAPQYIIYTSGTTGQPKGITRNIGGHLVGLQYTIEHFFGIRAGDTIFTASDLGWVVGHSYILYAPLLVGATTVLFEGKPVGTPDASTFWRIISEWKVNVLSTAPTALRAIKREDPGLEMAKKFDISSLRAIFLAGERSEPSIVTDFQNTLFGPTTSSERKGLVVDNWWSSESGSPITGISLGLSQTAPIKPGSAGMPMPGWDLKVVSDNGVPLPPNQSGNIVLATPLAPTGLTELWSDENSARLHSAYFSRFAGKGDWFDTGDAGFLDEEGYVHVMSRTDDVINVAAHRFSTGSIEEAILAHGGIGEAYVVGAPDEVKGHVPFAVVVLKASSLPPQGEDLLKEVNDLVKREIGPIAVLSGVVIVDKVPRTRSGKTLRRVVRAVVENAVKGEFGKEVEVPATVEDESVIAGLRERVEGWFLERGRRGGGGKAKL
ncbi:acetyl-CoA synthetase-like protein [Choiromyces venosus 120613-1]|uniref:Acetyl-CoA synthetase-like protein n=1 Tax=Choiromyces venosus 120613-1 TaxID=1336337 RepID=A0A3N4J073_9PEZI|nr:acetyl-CoA synthetase-like protein [Choiromyces venosus 120613-1]